MHAAIITIVLFFFFALPVHGQNLLTVQTPQQLLEAEIQKMISAGPLRTSYVYGPDFRYNFNEYNQSVTVQEFDDYFHNPADTLYTLAIAYPYVNASIQSQLRTYLQQEFTSMAPYKNDHRGTGGAYREYNDVPAEVRGNYQTYYDIASSVPTNLSGFIGWNFNPFNFYALYKYAQIMGNAQEILTLLSNNGHANPGALPADTVLQPRPHVLNSYIAGYYGYKGLRQLAGLSVDATNESRLTSALQKKVQFLPQSFSDVYNMSVYESGGYLWLVPELGDYLRTNALSTVATSVSNLEKMLPYWMIPNVDEGTRLENDFYNEGALSHLYDQSSIFLAKAYILKLPQTQLVDYLHNSGMWRGDLFHIQNIVATLQASGTIPTQPPPSPSPTASAVKAGDANGDNLVDGRDYVIWAGNYNKNVTGPTAGDFDSNGIVDGRDYVIWMNNYGK